MTTRSFSSYFIPDRALFGCYPSTDNKNALLDEGVRYFVDLTVPGEVKQRYGGVAYVNYPIQDRKVPTDTPRFASLVLAVVGRITHLAPGDVIPLTRRTDEPLDVSFGGVKKFRGHAGLRRGRWQLQLQQYQYRTSLRSLR